MVILQLQKKKKTKRERENLALQGCLERPKDDMYVWAWVDGKSEKEKNVCTSDPSV